MKTDLLALWAWEFDADFVRRLGAACERARVSMLAVDGADMASLAKRLVSGDIDATAVLDRVWDWGGEYESHVPAVQTHVPLPLNDYARVRAIWNKPYAHYLLMDHGLRVPHLVILPSLEKEPAIKPKNLAAIAQHISVKGAHSGGSGVLLPVRTWAEIEARRHEWPADETLLQEWIEPRLLGGRRAWFRVFYACGAVYPCWQDDRTHIQQAITASEERLFGLDRLRGITQQIATLCGLNVFSTEIALDDQNRWVVVDYINDPPDFRLKSTVSNGVPDDIVDAVADRIAAWVKRRRPMR